ncbi:MAG: NADH:ubiquinone reductase (Na(+)-transporting) subunit B [Desulfobacterales bacterium]|nr:NADH:ubiquinone reductase (Na(+)-transporting) subunit B [Desulfobacterales bacterium]
MTNLLNRFFDSQRKYFEPGAKLERLNALFEAFETVFLATGETTSSGPHVRDSLDVKRFMVLVIVSLMPAFFFGLYNTGYQSNIVSGLSPDFMSAMTRGLRIVMPLVIVSYTVGFFWELLFAAIRRHNISEGFFVTALLFPMTLPPTIPLWQAAIGISFGVIFGKEVFGGTGRNFLNPALTGRAFLFFAYPVKMTGDAVWTAVASSKETAVDAITAATPLSLASATERFSSIQDTLSGSGYSFMKLFVGNYPGSIGGTSALFSLIGAVFLLILGIISYRILIGGIIGVLATGILLNIVATEASTPWFSLNPSYHLVMGGIAFALAFMATEPVSAPDMNKSKWFYGFAIGALTVLIRVFNPAFPEGAMLAVLFMNLFAPLLDHIEVKIRLGKRIPNV